MPFGGGVAVGIAVSALVGFMMWPAAPVVRAPEPPAPALAAEPAPERQPAPEAPPAPAAEAPQPEPAAAATPPPTAATPKPAAASAPSQSPQPAAAAPSPAKPAADAPKPQVAASAPAPATPVDPDSQDAKLAAAAQVHKSAGTPIDNMLDQALSPQERRDKAAPAPASLPVTPTRDDVIKAMNVLVPAIRGCAQGGSGLATVTFVVKNDGHVESAAVSGAPFEGTASGRCMEGVVRRARLSRFQQPSVRMQFPFAIR